MKLLLVILYNFYGSDGSYNLQLYSNNSNPKLIESTVGSHNFHELSFL